MKKLFFISLVISFNLFAECKLSVPERELDRIVNPPIEGHYLKCEDFKNDRCICIEKVNTWYAEVYIDSNGKKQIRESEQKKQQYLEKKQAEKKKKEEDELMDKKIMQKIKAIAIKQMQVDGEI